MATIKDVAKLAHVSPATVSRYLNNHGYVSTDARKRISRAIETLNYVPNEVARSLFQKKSKLIGLLLPDISNPFFPLVAQGVEDYFHQFGYHVILGNINENPDKISDYIRVFQQNFVSGILSAVPLPDTITDKPIVFVDRDEPGSEYSIKADNVQGAQLILDAISNTSYENIVVIQGPQDVKNANTRFYHLTELMDKQDMPYHVMPSASYLLEDAFQTAKDLFKRYPKVDTIIASNDIQAMAVIQRAHKLGIHIPEDVQVIGFDNIPLSELTTPRLTTIQQPGFKMGWQAAEMLHQHMKEEIIEQPNIVLPVEYIKRESLRDN